MNLVKINLNNSANVSVDKFQTQKFAFKSNNTTSNNSEFNLNSVQSISNIAKICKTPDIIRNCPKNFSFIYTGDNIKEFISSVDCYSDDDPLEYISSKSCEDDFVKFKEEIETSKLEKLDYPVSTYSISNYVFPCGSIAIPARLNEDLSTNGLLQCCAIAFVDKKHNLQTLLHLCPTINKTNNEELINYILDASKPDDLEISIVPGSDKSTDKTLRFFMDTLRKKMPNVKVNFLSFPDKNGYNVILKQGKLYTADNDNIIIKETNPKNKIIHAGVDYTKEAKDKFALN